MGLGIRTFFKKIPDKYPTIFKPTFFQDTKSLVEKFIKPADCVLDAGSGSSPYTINLNNEIVALDIPPKALSNKKGKGWMGFTKKNLALLKARPNVKIVYGDITKMPFSRNIFDKVICIEVLEHIYDSKKAFSEINRVLKKNGRLFLTTPNAEFVPVEDSQRFMPEHIRHYTSEELIMSASIFFKKVKIEKRFHFFRFFEKQYLYERLAQKEKGIKKYFLCSLSIFYRIYYNFFYCYEKKVFPGRYNLILVCCCPKTLK